MKSGCKKRKQKIIICICGMTGCGKSTAGRKIAEKHGLKYLSGGDALKALAIEAGYKPAGKDWWETDEGMRFLRQRMKNHEFDKEVDEKLVEWVKRGNVVLDSRTMPWLLKNGFKIWLEVSPEERARRLAMRDGISFKKALNAMREKDEKSKILYKSLYGFDFGEDFSPFNLIFDTSELSADEVFQALCMVIDSPLLRES